MATSQEGTASIEELAQLEAQVAEQAAKVRDLKKSKAPQDEIKPAVAELLRRKKVRLIVKLPSASNSHTKIPWYRFTGSGECNSKAMGPLPL